MQKSKLQIKIQNDLNEAVKREDEIVRSTLRMLLAAILNKEKEKKYKEKIEGEAQLTDEEVVGIVFSEIKKRKEAILEFSAHGGLASGEEKDKIENAINKEKKEMAVLQKYLPEQLSEEEIRKLIKEAVEKTGASEIKDIGKVMAEIMPKVKGRADGSQVSQIVKELLIPKENEQ